MRHPWRLLRFEEAGEGGKESGGRKHARTTHHTSHRQDRQTDGLIDRQTDRDRRRQTDRRTDRRTDGRTDGLTDRDTQSLTDRDTQSETEVEADRRHVCFHCWFVQCLDNGIHHVCDTESPGFWRNADRESEHS